MRIVISLIAKARLEELFMPRKASDITIDSQLCKGCHICIHVCPQNVLQPADHVDNRGFYLPVVVNLDACKLCRLCELECPDFAISVHEEE